MHAGLRAFVERQSARRLARLGGGGWHLDDIGLERSVIGVYHHVSSEHQKRYLAEFGPRYNERIALGVNDVERTQKAPRGIVWERLVSAD